MSNLVGELAVQSDEFRERWASHNVRLHYAGMKSFNHPIVGRLDLGFQALELAQDPGLSLTVYPAEPGSTSYEVLRLLASWAAGDDTMTSLARR